MTLQLHPEFEPTFKALKTSLPQAVLLVGPHGVGLGTIARALAGDAVGAIVTPEDASGQHDEVSGTIKIEKLRSLYRVTRGKTTTREVIVIDDADTMTVPAQNAFLKLLEEPRATLSFILTTHRPELLLPTIRSRASSVAVPPIPDAMTMTYIDELGLGANAAQALFIARGLPAELTRLAHDHQYFDDKRDLFSQARHFINSDTYQKIVTVSGIKDRGAAITFCDVVLSILLRAHSEPALRQVKKLLAARDALTKNGSVRLQLLLAVV